MVRMADFFKKENDPSQDKSQEEKVSELPKESPPKEEARPIKFPLYSEIKKEIIPEKKPAQTPAIEPAQIMKEGLKIEPKPVMAALYQQAIALVRKILENGIQGLPIEGREIKATVDKIIDQLSLGNYELVTLTAFSSPENYLLSHSVNVCIISIMLGLGSNYTKLKLSDLGVAAFLHDIGMLKFEDISSRPSKLTNEEYQKIKHHPQIGAELLRNAKDITQTAIYVAQEHHERVDGQGYPKGLAGEKITEFARIVAIADAYEALTHPRAQREKLLPYDAIKEMLKGKERYDQKFLRVLIEQLGIYPIGSWVQLSTNEIGQVISVNKNSPLRPIVNVTADPQGRKSPEEKVLDLLKYPTLFIKRPVDEKEAGGLPA
ncbi:MAG: HD-GYP domain-containing protein [Candidatus Omnitrophota bacterium]|nr:HD-GYP domain-containing protein [Candidatus Omnitrophota bacterium]